jgi:hypothetical protein
MSSPEASSSGSGKTEVSRQATNKITYKITLIAEAACTDLIADFNNCAKGRSMSMVWACRKQYSASQDCIHQL